MFTVEDSVSIDRPVEAVFAFIADPTTYPRWRGDVVAVEPTSPSPLRRGSTFDQIIASFLGRQRFTFEVIGYEPSRQLELRATSGPVRPIVMSGGVKKRNSQDLPKLKQVLEG